MSERRREVSANAPRAHRLGRHLGRRAALYSVVGSTRLHGVLHNLLLNRMSSSAPLLVWVCDRLSLSRRTYRGALLLKHGLYVAPVTVQAPRGRCASLALEI